MSKSLDLSKNVLYANLNGRPVQLDDQIQSVHIWSQEVAYKNKGRYKPTEISQEVYDERIAQEINKIIPTPYPSDLYECLRIVENIKYESFGFPMFFLDYDYSKLTPSDKKWSCAFRNPCTFENPKIECPTPLLAVHEMFDFLRTRKIKMRIK